MTPFRYDAETHTYYRQDGSVVPSITELLRRSGVVDAEWFTDAGRERGTEVHNLTADFDLGALTLDECLSPNKGFLAAHVQLCQIARPKWEMIEQALVDQLGRFAGRPDRVGYWLGGDELLVADIKTGAAEKWHSLQTALQAILVAPYFGVAPASLKRYTIYYKKNGRYKVEEHVDLMDFNRALVLIQEFGA